MGWWSWSTAMCEEKKEEKGDEKPAKTKEKPDQQKDNDKPDASSKKKDSEGPKNLGESPKAAEKETQTAREQKDEGAHASSKAGQAEPVAVRKYPDEEAKRRKEEHEDSGGNKSQDAPDPDDEEQIQVKTVPYDPRFPATNQARNCYTRYNEFYKCIAEKGEDEPECQFYQRAYRSICPSEWVEGWNEAREGGNWFGKY